MRGVVGCYFAERMLYDLHLVMLLYCMVASLETVLETEHDMLIHETVLETGTGLVVTNQAKPSPFDWYNSSICILAFV